MVIEGDKEFGSNTSKYSILWEGSDGEKYYGEARKVRFGASEVEIESAFAIPAGTSVCIEAADSHQNWNCIVASCKRDGHTIGLVLSLSDAAPAEPEETVHPCVDELDYYDVLQISSNADLETIHRVYRIMAARFHPDNVETGDLDKFLSLKQAYETLTNAERRQEYDAKYQGRSSEPMPIFEMKDFVTGVEAEANRRLGVMSLLYNQRRRDPEHPVVSLLDLEQRMDLPREYLTFTLWYLRAKEYVTMADNSDFCMTAGGADYVESNVPRNEVLNQLLQTGSGRAPTRTRAGSQPPPALRTRRLQLDAGPGPMPN